MSKKIRRLPLFAALKLEPGEYPGLAGDERVAEAFLKISQEQHPELVGDVALDAHQFAESAETWRRAYHAYQQLRREGDRAHYLEEGHDAWREADPSRDVIPPLEDWRAVHLDVVADVADRLLWVPPSGIAAPLGEEVLKDWLKYLPPVWRHDDLEQLLRESGESAHAWDVRRYLQAVLEARADYELRHLAQARFAIQFKAKSWSTRGRSVGCSLRAIGANEASTWAASPREVRAGLDKVPHFQLVVSASWWLVASQSFDEGQRGVAVIRALHKLLTQARGPIRVGEARVEDLPIQTSAAHLALYGAETKAEAQALFAAVQHPHTRRLLGLGEGEGRAEEPRFFDAPETPEPAAALDEHRDADVQLASDVAQLARSLQQDHGRHHAGLDLDEVVRFADELAEVAAARGLSGKQRASLKKHREKLGS